MSLPETVCTTLAALSRRHDEIETLLQDPEVIANRERYTRLLREHGTGEKRVRPFREWSDLTRKIEDARGLVDDPELGGLAAAEVEEGEERLEAIESELLDLVLVGDEDDDRDVNIEIRAGTGGDEAALFAVDLYRLYAAYCERRGYTVEVLDARPTELGGYREITFAVSGPEAFREFRYESGTHRVQRVPETETQGRIHTSVATVAVLPQADDVEVDLKREDLKIDTFCASGPGGQKVNKTSSAVRIVHIPTGIKAECQDEKSQHKNKARAMQILKARIYDQLRAQAHEKRAQTRRGQIGTGDRSARIRTYNFPQNRLTDHRINLSIYDLQNIMLGDLEPVVAALRKYDKEQRLAAMS